MQVHSFNCLGQAFRHAKKNRCLLLLLSLALAPNNVLMSCCIQQFPSFELHRLEQINGCNSQTHLLRNVNMTSFAIDFTSGVGNLFCTADRFENEIFSRTGFQKPQMFSNEYLLQIMQANTTLIQ